ncbi:MAG: acyltransferase [Betaproteobacteria bacterium]|nr:acyltransferase [Betaproteobacteria bacterium]
MPKGKALPGSVNLPPRLSQLAQNRDNNFNLIRFVAALTVLVDHSFPLVTGTSEAEPFRDSLGIALGNMAVDVFFITSGFLVTASLLQRKSLLAFVWARILRIYPALIVMVLLCVFALGLWFTSLSPADYLAHPATRLFALQNSTLVTGVVFSLPGVFSAIPYRRFVNGSLWTMPIEMYMYISLALLWLALAVFRSRQTKILRVATVVIAAALLGAHLSNHFRGHPDDNLIRLSYMFFAGAAFFAMRDHVRLSRAGFSVAAAVLLMSIADKNLFFAAYDLSVPYILLWLAYIPAGAIRRFNGIGDYSYGFYIYAFPIQQSIMATVAGMTVAGLIAYSTPITLVFAVLSWHCIEKHALRYKFDPA